MDREVPPDDRSARSIPLFPGALPNPNSEALPASTLSSFSWSSQDSGKSNISRLSPRPLVSTPSSGFSATPASHDRLNSFGGLPLQGAMTEPVDRPMQEVIDSLFHEPEARSGFAPIMGQNSFSAFGVTNGGPADRPEDYALKNLSQGQLPISIPHPRTASAQSIPSVSTESDRLNGIHLQDSLFDFDNRLRRSNVLRNILDRLVQCELTTKSIQGELGILHQKINLLLDRTNPVRDQIPEFRDPFAITPNVNQQKTPISATSRILPPHVRDVSVRPDELSQLTARLNTLTNSVSQILALQTQQQTHSNNGLSINSGQGINMSLDGGMKKPVPQSFSPNSAAGLGFPQRPEFRGPGRVPNTLPSRTWSTGNIELTIGNSSAVLRHDPMFKSGKRGSVAVHPRKDSPGLLESPMDSWPSALSQPPSTREQTTSVKWDSLPISPDLLRAIAKFGLSPPNKVQQRALPFLLKGSDVIAQAPPTQERIAAYAIPAINMALSLPNDRPLRGPLAVLVSTTVDQATQAQRMIRDLGTSLGIRSSLAVGTSGGNGNILQELRLLHHNLPHILCGTPQKLHALFTAPGGIAGSDVRLFVLDEVDQLIARNLQEFVHDIVKLLPASRNRLKTPASNPSPPLVSSPQDSSPEGISTFQHTAFKNRGAPSSTADSAELVESPESGSEPAVTRQTALFSNTVPQDVLNLANAIDLREPVRVLVRRDGSGNNSEGGQGTRGLRQFYLYLAFTSGSRKEIVAPAEGLGIIGSGRANANNAESVQAREWKLDALADLFEDIDVPQVIVHVGGLTALDNVVYKLANRGLDAIPLHGEMNGPAKLAALNKFRGPPQPMLRPPTRILVVNEVQLKAPDVFQIPLIINYDLPKAVEEYAQRVAPAVSSTYSKAGVVINFVTATGGDVEMLRSIECFYKIKCPEVPTSLRDLL